jgi:hypothetical protein
MSIQFNNSTDTVTASGGSGALVGFPINGMKNRIIDGGFIINQRGYTTGTSLSAGSYGHDRWKAGSGGGTYTFTQGSLGVNTTVTITAGTLVQFIEGCNLAEGGTYVLSWTGTAQGRLNGGTYGSSGTVTVTGWTAGANLSVEFNTGTLGSVQLEKGSTATSFDYRPYGTELALCQRYLPALSSTSTSDYICSAYTANSTTAQGIFPFLVTPRVPPTGLTVSPTNPINYISAAVFSGTSPVFSGAGYKNAVINVTVTAGVAGQGGSLYFNSASGVLLFTGCEL